MKSFCIKSNNIQILNYLQEKIATMPLPNIYYSQKKFKNYSNIIIHYVGEDITCFINFFSHILTDCIIHFFEDSIVSRIINYNYFYFDTFEKKIIKENCIEAISSHFLADYDRKETIKMNITNYLSDHKSVIVDGFVNFRISNYMEYLDNIVDISVNKYIIDREYSDFINLLKAYIDSKSSTIDLVHLIYTSTSPILLDENKDLVNLSTNNIVNTTYLSDISFSSCDYILNTLLTIIPKKIIVHLVSEEDDFITSLKLIFAARVSICTDCEICKTYSLLYNSEH